ncbi:hypothetical protein HMPREF1143_1773 [Peptoanaerobacter stomatis]|uniref:Uncharacterized protein n=1 Tax=Peptoanaerobacter stomatis TaxID=796937 RepID=J6HIS5_9FIRM|nr:hypothetical protein [Peptoanaerobacter stomatis]EJU22538.1 hypothetical protein HMPREF1143_1773 [Peptoanaerobacter stomatis]
MSKSATDSKRRYNEKNYDRLYITVKAGEKEKINNIAKKQNQSLNDFVNSAIYNYIDNLKEK